MADESMTVSTTAYSSDDSTPEELGRIFLNWDTLRMAYQFMRPHRKNPNAVILMEWENLPDGGGEVNMELFLDDPHE